MRRPLLTVAAVSLAFWAVPAACLALYMYGPGWAVHAAAYVIGGGGVGLVLFGWGYVRGIRESDRLVEDLATRLVDTRRDLLAAARRARDFPPSSSVIWADFDRSGEGR